MGVEICAAEIVFSRTLLVTTNIVSMHKHGPKAFKHTKIIWLKERLLIKEKTKADNVGVCFHSARQ